MFLSQYFLPTTKDISSDIKIISHKLMLKAGLIKQLASGIYCWLPLGLKVLKNVESIIRDEMNKIGANEILLPHLHPASIWEQSGRLNAQSDLSEQMFKTKDHASNNFLLAPSAEEASTKLFAESIQSYKDLGKILYQINTKFRDEIRPRFGVMRAREFSMKDAYSFDETKEKALENYEKIFQAYLQIFKRLEVQAIPVIAPTGAMGGNYSHEFHLLANTGESKIFYEKEILDAIMNDNLTLETYDQYYANEEEKHIGFDKSKLKDKIIEENKSIEVGHLFYYGKKYSESMSCTYQTAEGKLNHPETGAYGIGISRLIGAIIEKKHDDNGIIWPSSIAPFKVAIINLANKDQTCTEISMSLYNKLQKKGIEVLFDDTNSGAGVKFAKMDLIGIPFQLIIGKKYKNTSLLELKERSTGQITELDFNSVINFLSNI